MVQNTSAAQLCGTEREREYGNPKIDKMHVFLDDHVHFQILECRYFHPCQASQCLDGEVLVKKIPVQYIHKVLALAVQKCPSLLFITVLSSDEMAGEWVESPMPLELICSH